jgi:hypothetical protein
MCLRFCLNDALNLSSWYLVDAWGRRTILLSGAVIVCFGFVCFQLTLILFRCVLHWLPPVGGWLLTYHRQPKQSLSVLLCLTLVMVTVGDLYLGSILLRYFKLRISSLKGTKCRYDQIMPLSVRAKGVSLSTATNWFFNFVVGELTPYLQETMGWRLYPMHGFFCALSFIVGK